MTWAKYHDKCVKCGTDETPHLAKGFCLTCYHLNYELNGGRVLKKERISEQYKYGERTTSISRELLERQYADQEMSPTELARQHNCTRQYIHKLLRKYGIHRRTQRSARNLAISQGKIGYTRTDNLGIKLHGVLQKINFNKSFFKTWSPEMAYVLGVICTDGNLQPGRERDANYKGAGSRISIAQKEPELLEKVSALLDCDAKIYRSKQARTGNPIHTLQILSEELYDDLLKLGLTSNKSLTLQFPSVPAAFIRHFIRGCWDGDGSVYLEKNNLSKPCASFVSGSKQFILAMLNELCTLGMPPRTLHKTDRRVWYQKRRKRRVSYYFRFTGIDCVKLFEVLYDGVLESMYLRRKYEIFKAIADNFSGYAFERLKLADGKFAGRHIVRAESSVLRQAGRSEQSHALPSSLTRSRLAEILGILPRQVTSIMRSSAVRAELRHLADEKNEPTIDKLTRLIFEKGIQKHESKRVQTLSVSLPLTHQDLAEMLGISPAQVNAIMASPLVRAEIEQLAYDPEEITIERIKRLIVEEGLLNNHTKTT